MSIDERMCYTVQATFLKVTENPAIDEVCDCFHLFSNHKETILSWQQIDTIWMPCCRSSWYPGCSTAICVYCYRLLHFQVLLITPRWLVMQLYLVYQYYSAAVPYFLLLHNGSSTRTEGTGTQQITGIWDPIWSGLPEYLIRKPSSSINPAHSFHPTACLSELYLSVSPFGISQK